MCDLRVLIRALAAVRCLEKSVNLISSFFFHPRSRGGKKKPCVYLLRSHDRQALMSYEPLSELLWY